MKRRGEGYRSQKSQIRLGGEVLEDFSYRAPFDAKKEAYFMGGRRDGGALTKKLSLLIAEVYSDWRRGITDVKEYATKRGAG